MNVVSDLLSREGPSVSCVLVRPGHAAEEIVLDMTPKKAMPTVTLGGTPTFAGTLPALDVVVMVLADQEAAEGLGVNDHTLPIELQMNCSKRSTIRGPILMIRMDED